MGARGHGRPLSANDKPGTNNQPSTTMLRRIIYEDWQLIFPVIALLAAAAVYLSAAWRAWHMTPKQADEQARRPLDHG